MITPTKGQTQTLQKKKHKEKA
jgi:hypothetical protein